MEIPHLDTEFSIVLSEIFGHGLGESSNQNALPSFRYLFYGVHEVVYLAGRRFDQYFGVNQTRRPDDLFYYMWCLFQFIGTGSSRDIDRLVDPGFKFLECQRPIVECGWKTKAEFDECFLS